MLVKNSLMGKGIVAILFATTMIVDASADASTGGLARSYIDVSALPSGVGYLSGYQDSSGTNSISLFGTGTANASGNATDLGYPNPAYSAAAAGASSSGPYYSSGEGSNLTNIAYDCLVNSNSNPVDFQIPWHYLVQDSGSIQSSTFDTTFTVARAYFYDGSANPPMSISAYSYGNDVVSFNGVQMVTLHINAGEQLCIGVSSFVDSTARTTAYPLPEPGTVALLAGSTTTGLALFARRRRK